jgi:hypothetical protein
VSLGPITTIPYTARVPASSNCTPFSSASVYSGLPQATGAATTAVGSAGASASRTSGGATAATGSGSGAAKPTSGAEGRMAISGVAVVGLVLSVMFLA